MAASSAEIEPEYLTVRFVRPFFADAVSLRRLTRREEGRRCSTTIPKPDGSWHASALPIWRKKRGDSPLRRARSRAVGAGTRHGCACRPVGCASAQRRERPRTVRDERTNDRDRAPAKVKSTTLSTRGCAIKSIADSSSGFDLKAGEKAATNRLMRFVVRRLADDRRRPLEAGQPLAQRLGA
jgi:hypothetical protein